MTEQSARTYRREGMGDLSCEFIPFDAEQALDRLDKRVQEKYAAAVGADAWFLGDAVDLYPVLDEVAGIGDELLLVLDRFRAACVDAEAQIRDADQPVSDHYVGRALSFEAREKLKAAVIGWGEWSRHHFGSSDWDGDECGCPDSRCTGGYHHDSDEPCGCLDALIEGYLAERDGK